MTIHSIGLVTGPAFRCRVEGDERMIPFKTRDADEYSFAVPWADIGLIVLNFLVFFYELALDLQGSALDRFLNAFSLVPCE